jgi:hypothetical protein
MVQTGILEGSFSEYPLRVKKAEQILSALSLEIGHRAWVGTRMTIVGVVEVKVN